MIKDAIQSIVSNRGLTEVEMAGCIKEIMEGHATDAQIGSFLTALRMKGETIEEITGAARIMREKATKIKAPEGVLDTCGTGGALGIKIDLTPEKVESCLFETGFGFLFAPLFHPAMKFAIGPRREMGIRTIFNILGPITNPAGAKRQILGVYSDTLTETLAIVLGNLGADDAIVVHGEDGLDEVSISSRTKVSRFNHGKTDNFYTEPEDFGLKRGKIEDIRGGTKGENAAITLSILKGETGPRRDIVLMNSAFALIAAGKTEDINVALSMAVDAIDSGRALEKLKEVKRVSNAL